jgi:prepilin-type N-terminal cleavage/methylation domain-containing protein
MMPPDLPPANRRGFTLIELLIVVSILAILVGMVASLVGVTRRYGMRSQTLAVMHKVESAVRLFQRDVGVLPYQLSYPDAVSPSAPYSNLLARRLGAAQDAATATNFNAAVATAAGKYTYFADLLHEWNGNWEGSTTGNSWASNLTYRFAYLISNTQVNGNRGNSPNEGRRYAVLLNRVAAQRARQAVYAGALDLPGPFIVGPTSTSAVQDLTGTPLLSAAERGSLVTGWCGDYLEGALTPRDIVGDDIVDAWRRPLVYVGQVLPRARSSSALILGTMIKSQDLSWYGLGATGFKAGTGPWNTLVATKRWRLLQNGRVTIGANCLDDAPAPSDPQYNPTGNALDSDRRYYAAPGYEQDFELWSAGPDGRLEWRRGDTVNRDNIPLTDYDRGLR